MGEFKHLVVAKFKDGVDLDEILKEMEKLVSEVDCVKSYEWGTDIESHEMLTQGFTHVFLITFHKKEDYTSFVSHPKHVEFASVFSVAIEKVVLLDFPAIAIKPPAPAPIKPPAPAPPKEEEEVVVEEEEEESAPLAPETPTETPTEAPVEKPVETTT